MKAFGEGGLNSKASLPLGGCYTFSLLKGKQLKLDLERQRGLGYLNQFKDTHTHKVKSLKAVSVLLDNSRPNSVSTVEVRTSELTVRVERLLAVTR